MNDAIQTKIIKTFEEIKRADENGVEYWSARELAPILDYSSYDSFLSVIERAQESVKNSGIKGEDQFHKFASVVRNGGGREKVISDYKLTRYACYIIAQNGSPTKEAIAAAQMYFAVQTRKHEVMSAEIEEIQRLEARKKLTETERKFSQTLYDRGVDGKGISEIRAVGDQTLFGGHTTQQMKDKLSVKQAKPLADVLPTVTIKAKDLAVEMTTVNTKGKNLQGKSPIKNEHVTNNQEVRALLKKRGIVPEELPAEEDIKKLRENIKADRLRFRKKKLMLWNKLGRQLPKKHNVGL